MNNLNDAIDMVNVGIKLEKKEYDLDIVDLYYKVKQLATIEFSDQLKQLVEIELKNNLLDTSLILDSKFMHVIPCDRPGYPLFMGISLIWYDPNLIDFFLDYQESKYKNQEFIDMVEFRIYKDVKNKSPFDNKNRLKEIIKWVKRKRKKSTELINSNKKKNLSFGYKEKSIEKLSRIYSQLNSRVFFLNEELTPKEDFIGIFTSENLLKAKGQIHLSCQTYQFCHIIDKMSALFEGLNPTTIGKSELFYSKKGTLIKRSNLYVSKKEGSKGIVDIDEILNSIIKNI